MQTEYRQRREQLMAKIGSSNAQRCRVCLSSG
jgi:hypothetical protein